MQTIKPENNESNNAPKQIAGAVANRVGGGFLKLTIAIVIIIVFCAGITWFISSRVSADTQSVVDKSVPTVYSVQTSPTPIPTPERIGYTSIGDASISCEDGGTVIQLWRGGDVVGFACNKDMDAVRAVSDGVQLVLPEAQDHDDGR